MSQNTKDHLISAGITFAATFFTAIGVEITATGGKFEFTGAFVASILLAAVRAAFKAAAQKWLIDSTK